MRTLVLVFCSSFISSAVAASPLTDRTNNPCAITYRYANGAVSEAVQTLKAKGVKVKEGPRDRDRIRPIMFRNLDDGVKACKIILNKLYGESELNRTITKWCGGKNAASYARTVAREIDFPLFGKTISKMTRKQLDHLVVAIARWEGGGNSAIALKLRHDFDRKYAQKKTKKKPRG